MRKPPFPRAGAAMLPLAAWLAAAGPVAADTSLTWETCDPVQVGGQHAELGERLRCARVTAPLDHERPDGRTIEVGVVRVSAARPGQREGALFFNIGGPGANPSSYLPSMATSLSAVSADDALHGSKRLLADRYDLIAVIPRGLKGGWQYDCASATTFTHAFLPTHRDDANWQRVLDDTQRQSVACLAPGEARYLSTAQHVHDMDLVRRLLGDDRINFYGVSYGGRVGAWYGAMYPQHLDRMLLDSSMIFPGSYLDAAYATFRAREQAFERDILGPVLAEPRRYGQPDDADDITWRAGHLHPAVRESWHGSLSSPAYLAAALTMNRWIERDGWRGWAPLAAMASSAFLSADRATQHDIREAAEKLVTRGTELAQAARGFEPPLPRPRPPSELPDALFGVNGISVNLAVLCNDEYWTTDTHLVRARADRDAFSYPLSDGSHILDHLVCSRWPKPISHAPDLDQLVTQKPFLMIQSELDTATPLVGARRTLQRFANAHLVIAKGATTHGLLGRSETPCIEIDAFRYLLDGSLPAGGARESSCDYVAPTGDDEYGDYHSYETYDSEDGSH